MINEIAEKFGATSGRDFEKPLDVNFDPTYDDDEPDLDQSIHPYRSLIGSLLYVVGWTRPDCLASLNTLCTAMARPQMKHYKAGLRLARYLYLTRELGLSYTANINERILNKLSAMVDASWNVKSREGWLIKLNGASVAHSSRLINTVCLSSAQAETSAAVSCCKVVLWIRMLLWELDYEQPGSTKVEEDSKATIPASSGDGQRRSGDGQRRASRYYQMRTAWLRQLVRTGIVHFSYVPTADQTADALSKNVAVGPFKKAQTKIFGPQPSKLPM